jgi:translation initiation factor 1
MDLKDQLRELFPDHEPEPSEEQEAKQPSLWIQDDPIICKYEKRNGRPVTLLEGYNGADKDFEILSREIKQLLGVGGSFKKGRILIQGDYRDRIMDYLKQQGFKVKRVGG